MNETNDKLKNLENRINKLKQRIIHQKIGPEVETAKKILYKLEIKYEKLKSDSNIFVAEATSVEKINTFLEEELIQKLGAIYWIFGSNYEEVVSFKRYRIEFLQVLPEEEFWQKCLMKVQVHIYEDDIPFMMKDTQIEFWKGWKDSAEVDDINILSNETNEKYNNFHWFEKISYTLAKTWNEYFNNVPLIEAKKSGLMVANMNRYLESKR